MKFKRKHTGISAGKRRQAFVTVAIAMALLASAAPLEAGVIPWLYNAIFGPVYYPPPAYYAGYGYAGAVYPPAYCGPQTVRKMPACVVAPPCGVAFSSAQPTTYPGNGFAGTCDSRFGSPCTVTYASPVCPSAVHCAPVTCAPPASSCLVESAAPARSSPNPAQSANGSSQPSTPAAPDAKATFQQPPDLPGEGFEPRESVPPADQLDTPPKPSSDASDAEAIETTIRQRKPAPARTPEVAPPEKASAEPKFLPPATPSATPAESTAPQRSNETTLPEEAQPTSPPAGSAKTPPAALPEPPRKPAVESRTDPFSDIDAGNVPSDGRSGSAQRLTQRPSVVYVPALRRAPELPHAPSAHAIAVARRVP